MKIYSAQVKGKNKAACEDVIFTDEDNNGFHFIGIADGQSGRQRSAEGARAVLMTVAEYLKKINLSFYKENSTEELRCKIAGRITQCLRILSESYHLPPSEFASTLCCIALNGKTGDFMILHLGDGMAAGAEKNYYPEIISYPDNGITKSHTYLTVSPSLASHIRIKSGELEKYACFLLATDGAELAYYLLNRMHMGSVDCELPDDDQLSKLLAGTEPEDDATLVLVDLYS